ncbi:hypothetical protein E1A91_D04G108900v1 [Gossypium mustelinum]|uniref:Uncharacterized protein n=1 Tax=Gossypium mustelinum TaxID=34275 RepID=A0A5D2VCK9_GOSMU|nr:hypothetical protein E1A91_D04G108900v1 [Gossypium mustelinum]
MSSPMILKNPNSLQRRQPLLHSRSNSVDSCITPRGNTNLRFGEVCGGTTADVAAVCCCCPCGLANLVVLAIYKVPAGLYRRALRQKWLRKLHKKGLLQPKNHGAHFRCNDPELLCLEDYFQDAGVSEETEKAAVELENEMWQRFYGTGFWRSPSQKEGETPRFHPL